MTNQPTAPIRVEATILQWRNGRYGRWATVEIHGYEKTSEATLGLKVAGHELPEGERFPCDIALNKYGSWSVVSLATDHLPERVEALVARVIEKRDKDYLLDPADRSVTRTATIRLSGNVAGNKHGILELRPGATIVADVVLRKGSYEVEILRDPQPVPAIFGTCPDMAQRFVAFAVNDWNVNREAKSVLFAVRSRDRHVYARLWIKALDLKRAGIKALRRMSLPETEDDEQSMEMAHRWSDILRNGSADEIEDLAIDRVIVELNPASNGQALDLHRLIAPRGMRMPAGDKETIEWVAGVVHSTHEQTRKSDVGSRTVAIQIDDHRIGRGFCVAFRRDDQLEPQGLQPGSRVVARIVATERYWKADPIHRVTPPSRTLHDDP